MNFNGKTPSIVIKRDEEDGKAHYVTKKNMTDSELITAWEFLLKDKTLQTLPESQYDLAKQLSEVDNNDIAKNAAIISLARAGVQINAAVAASTKSHTRR